MKDYPERFLCHRACDGSIICSPAYVRRIREGKWEIRQFEREEASVPFVDGSFLLLKASATFPELENLPFEEAIEMCTRYDLWPRENERAMPVCISGR